MARIVLAEDDGTMLHLLSTLLRMDGFEVEAVGSDEDVLTAVRRAAPDLLLLDMILPRQTGLEALDDIRRSEIGRSLRIIMISGLNVKEDCLRRGADDFLLKPFMPDDLIHMLRKHLQPSV